MSWAWDQPYPGGAMVPVPGFPRLLEPPSQRGGAVKYAGDDVRAYKRGVSRLGRWPWASSDTGGFSADFTYSFACGKEGGNVSDSGVAGTKRQQGWNFPNGLVDEQWFNFLRSARVPAGLPHAGEPALDVTAQNLIGEAWQQYAAAPMKSRRERALQEAIEWIGYTEEPPESNHTRFGSWYGADYQPWCCMFVSYCRVLEGCAYFVQGEFAAYVPYVVQAAWDRRNGLTAVEDPIPGDLCCYDWQQGGSGTSSEAYDHIGFFEDGDARSWQAVEGNTSADNNGSQSNGGGVFRRSRSSSSASVVFVRVAE